MLAIEFNCDFPIGKSRIFLWGTPDNMDELDNSLRETGTLVLAVRYLFLGDVSK